MLENLMVKSVGDELREGYYHLLASNGAFLVKRTPLLAAAKKVRLCDVFDLAEQDEQVAWRAPRVPAGVIARAVTFLRLVWELRSTEGFLFLQFNPSSQEYRVSVPDQVVTGGSVAVTQPPPSDDGWLVAGTVHSHPGGAFHSHTDMEGETKADGLHIVVGNLTAIAPQFSDRKSVV
jgi:hypothetical protein